MASVAKPPKTTAGQRIIPIQPALLPLLELLKRGKKSETNVIAFSSISEDHAATKFRDALDTAEVRRPRLTADNATEEQIDFRSLRDTHATWLALAGVADKVIQRRMGHASPTTTDRYVKAAETFAVDNVGAPFPALPASLLKTHWATHRSSLLSVPPKTSVKLVARVGFEPTTFGL